MDSIVALDIETTGLDPRTDAILEIGAVRFNYDRVESEWTTLIHPGRRIPPFITQLTGITDRMVLQSPPIEAVLPDLVNFVGNAPVVGHNIRFDMGFLRRQGVLTSNDVLDTYEMAAVLLPGAGRYNLGALTQFLEVPLSATHRALDDARATRAIFERLFEMALELPLGLLAELVRLAEPINWGGYLPFRLALQSRSREIVSAKSAQHGYDGALFRESREPLPGQLRPVEEPAPLDAEEVCAALEQGGAFARFFPFFEYRPQQVSMAMAVTEALSEGRHLLVEAGTGTGKSMAYLIPAAHWALKNGRRVVISTNTINLQDQLISKDIPDLRQALGLPVRAAVLKGRANYLCPRRLEILRRRGPQSDDEMRVLGKALVWMLGTTTGDRAELNLNGPGEWEVWRRISAEDEGCTAENCLRRFGGACPFYRAHQAAQNAHVLIVNHALLLADVATGNRVLPEYEYLVVDEAHHLEDATTNALSFRVTQADIDRVLRELGGPKAGALGWALAATSDVLSPADYASLNELVQRITDLAFRLENFMRDFFQTVDGFLYEQREGRPVGSYGQQQRIISATRIQPAWEKVEISWEETQRTLQSLLEALAKLSKGLVDITELLAEEDEDLYSTLANIYRRLAEVDQNLGGMVFEPSDEQIYWAEVNPTGYRLALNAAPLHIGPLMERYLWHEKQAVILTSATLTAGGEFDYLRGRLYAEDAYELSVGSPFDYETASLLYLVNDIPEPGDRHGHQRSVENALIRLCKATGGRTLALFTSYEQLRRTSQAISPVLGKEGILVYEQGEGASPHALLESFRTSERAVLLGTRSFWEGVDVPGEALSILVIVKLPFAVPSDPVVAARSETFEDPFYQYSLPEAILRFRQGFGRLIRSQQDRGVVAILDKRVLSKRYGRLFIESLPTCTVRVGPLANLPGAATHWLNL